jgi:pyrophosphate--fructose-6-phosphate 1-phosphotransferase
MKIAMLTAGGLAPCLSTALASLTEQYTAKDASIELIAYRFGYAGLLKGDSFVIDNDARRNAGALYKFGGSPIGNSRVKLTNAKDLVKRGLIKENENALEIAAEQLKKDGVDVLHTIGGDDTNTTAADLAAYLADEGYNLRVLGLPKTIDNDIVPIKQSFGASTAADKTVEYSKNVLAEHGASPKSLIIHEIMGRKCGYLTAESAIRYQQEIDKTNFNKHFGLSEDKWSMHAVYIPELSFDIEAEGDRLSRIMDEVGNVNIFFAEGAISEDKLIELMDNNVSRDAFGHIQLGEINPGVWLATQIAKKVAAEKVQVFKSGYFARSAWSNEEDLKLIKQACTVAVDAAINGDSSGVIGEDDNYDLMRPDDVKLGELSIIDFARIKGGKLYDASNVRFTKLLREIGQI